MLLLLFVVRVCVLESLGWCCSIVPDAQRTEQYV